MSEPTTIRSRGGRELLVFGDPALLTMDRMQDLMDRADTDPRIASLSLTPGPRQRTGTWLRAAGPNGPLIAVAADVQGLIGDVTRESLDDWCQRASERGFWHDWWVTSHADVTRATPIARAVMIDELEAADPSSSHYACLVETPVAAGPLSIAVDITWLGPFETGAQVLTTAAIGALGRHKGVREIRLFGAEQLPGYAQHLLDDPSVRLLPRSASHADRADIVWYPNQIDQRSNINAARDMGRRVVTTYLDLIAYDIPRYHGTPQAWQAYRALQRRIALSVDGITTISADVAERLLTEAPRLDPSRVRPLPLGLDHITTGEAVSEPDEDVRTLAGALRERPFVLVLGNDFLHKNRDFAIRVWQSLPQEASCDLVLAGLHVRSSSSRAAEEQARRMGRSDGRIHVVGHVSSGSRAWLLGHAAAVHYPSSAEGFGLVPYEAAALGTPTTFADFGPLREIAATPGLPPGWAVDAHADDLARLLTDPAARQARLDHLSGAITAHTWDGFADGLVAFFRDIASSPTVTTSAVAADSAASAQLAAIMSSRSWRSLQRFRGVARRMTGRR